MATEFRAIHPIDLYKALDAQFRDEEWLSWEPETLLRTLALQDEGSGVDKLLAIQAFCVNTDLALSDSVAFENLVHAFCNNVVVVDAPQAPYIEEVHYAVEQMKGLAKLVHHKDCVFVGEIPGYVAAVAKHRGWVLLPMDLSFAQALLDHLTGFSEGTTRRYSIRGYLDAAKDVANSLSEINPADLREQLKGVESLPQEAAQFLSYYLFDPTLPFKANA